MPFQKSDCVVVMLLASLMGFIPLAGSIAKSNNLGGRYNCACDEGTGSCTTSVVGSKVNCEKTGSDTCTTSCKMFTFTHGASGAAGKSHGVKPGSTTGGAGVAR